MTNFDFLKTEPKFSSFADVAVSAEKLLRIDVEASVLNCRRAMEFAVKWMYSADRDLDPRRFYEKSKRGRGGREYSRDNGADGAYQ